MTRHNGLNAPAAGMTRRSFLGALALSAFAMTSLSACGGGGDPLASDNSGSSSDTDTIVIGSADFSESQLIGTIYSHALQNAGVQVRENLNIGARQVYLQALDDGSIDLLPEYTGSLLNYYDSSSSQTDPEKIIDELKDKLPDGIEILDPSNAQNVDVVAVQQAFADENGLSNISDLAGIASEMTFGGPPEFETTYKGMVGLREVYGIEFKEFLSLDAGGPLTLAALVNGQCQAGDMFSSDPAIKDNNLIALEDDKGLFGFEQVIPLIRSSKATDTVKDTLNAVSAALTQENLMDMNRRVNNGEDLAQIADDWIATYLD